MVVRLAVSNATAGLVALGLGVAFSGEAVAQYNVLKECGSQYQAAKAANELGGQNWQDFLKTCRTRLQEQGKAPAADAEAAKPAQDAKPAEAAKPAPAESPKAAETKPAEAAPPAAEAPALNPLKPPPTAAQPAPAAASAEKPKDGRAAMRERQKACAAEWKEKKKEMIAADKKMTWPKFWSACNKRLKDGGQ